MPVFADHPRSRWLVPVSAVAVIAAWTVVASHPASADSGLSSRTAQQLLVDVQSSAQRALSGTVDQSADLGLPSIPGLSGQGTGAPAHSGGAASLTSMLTGTHTWRVWLGGPTQARVALVGGSGETDVVRNGADVWVWSSADKSAVHQTLTGKSATRSTPSTSPADLPKTPEEAAQKALAALDPTTSVTTDGTAKVAGRDAYELVLTPKASATTRVAQVRIAVDAKAHVPLRVQVYSTKAANPALQVGFTSVDFSAPDASRFSFTPPPGTTVTQGDPGQAQSAPSTSTGPDTKAKVVGSGWASVLVAAMPSGTATQGATADSQTQLQAVLGSLPSVSGSWGSGHVVDGTLFSAVLTDDGRIAVGAVAPEALYAALAAR